MVKRKMFNLFRRKKYNPIDIKIMDGEKTLYYLKWFPLVGFMKFDKEIYEKYYVKTRESK